MAGNRSYSGGWGDYPAYISVAERKELAAAEIVRLTKKGQSVAPIVLETRTIASTFWGKAWCSNLERYSDYASRLPRGRSYVRSGAVIDLRIEPGKVTALVRGSALYTVQITVDVVEAARWKAIVARSTGQIASVIELLRGKLAGAVMEIITRKGTGLFPEPLQIHFRCNCPDAAIMCKHVAAALYGVGARLDREPEMLFRLRGADPAELVTSAAAGAATPRPVAKEKALDGDLASLFGIDLEGEPAPPPPRAATPTPTPQASRAAAKIRASKRVTRG